MRSDIWKREELIVAFNLYCKIPFGRIHIKNPQIIALAKAIGRTPSSISWKLANFARLDPSLKERNIKGASHGSKGEEKIWEEFTGNWNQLAFESEKLMAEYFRQPLEKSTQIETSDLPLEGKERERVVKVRVNQQFFRKAVLSAYDFKCCITGIPVVELLNASHIIPWSVEEKNRVNPRNGLCLNALHDRAFDRGLLAITPEMTIQYSSLLQESFSSEIMTEYFKRYENQKINLPQRFLPEPSFLDYHRQNVFRA